MLKGRFKCFILILVLSFSLSLFSVQSFADTTSSGTYAEKSANSNNITVPEYFIGDSLADTITTPDGFCFNSETGEIYGYLGNAEAIEIPSQIKGIAVTGISDYAFEGCCSLKSVVIPNTVKSIGFYAFQNCINLTEINISSGLSKIKIPAFDGCDKLSAINIDAANASYSSLYGVLFDKNAEKLLQYPAGNTATSYAIPDGITKIGSHAFQNCTRLTNITIPQGVTDIGSYAFSGCTNLENLTIPTGVTTIDSLALENCNLTSLTLPKTLERVGEYGSLQKCNANTIILEDGTTDIVPLEFVGCSFQNIIIPKSITSIGDYAFTDSNLTEITIPSSVTIIGYNAFYYCHSLYAINVDAANENYSSKNGILFDKNQSTILRYPPRITDLSYSIPTGVTSIGETAFAWCSSLNSINIPNSVTSIGQSAFSWCSNLNSINIPNGITTFYSSILEGCTNLNSITIPGSVTKIFISAISDCNNLTIVTYPGTYADKFAQSNGIAVEYITVSECPEDINGDRAVNMQDVILAASHFNTLSTSSNFDKKCDLNNDGAINLKDIMQIAAKFNYVY